MVFHAVRLLEYREYDTPVPRRVITIRHARHAEIVPTPAPRRRDATIRVQQRRCVHSRYPRYTRCVPPPRVKADVRTDAHCAAITPRAFCRPRFTRRFARWRRYVRGRVRWASRRRSAAARAIFDTYAGQPFTCCRHRCRPPRCVLRCSPYALMPPPEAAAAPSAGCRSSGGEIDLCFAAASPPPAATGSHG